MFDKDTTLEQQCTELADETTRGRAWLDDNRQQIGGEAEGLEAELRRAGRFFQRCATAARRKMCVGVFGPSQAGKSYLISALARDERGTLLADFGGETHDFISEINPEGGKESTGLVTRFTMTPAQKLPGALSTSFPVQLRLLTEMDLVKILANTYYADCEHREMPDSAAVRSVLDRLQKGLDANIGRLNPSQNKAAVLLDDFEELQSYLTKHFRAKPRVQELERTFWTRALELGPQLNLEQRITLYSVLWNELAPFTDLLRRLVTALERIGHPDLAFCSLDALIPRGGSIIDVALLKGLSQENHTSDSGPAVEDNLEVLSLGGERALLPRAVVTALTAELCIVMREKPDDYFEHTDLLDFPGYRSRYKIDDVARELQKPDMLKELFLRGKVAYLFQRYCAERELTSMLLCIGPSNQEVQDLPGVIADWIGSTHGESSERRQGKPVSLYMVLTKFDMEFEQKKGAPSLETRWDNRLSASLLDFFGKQHDWPRQWDGSKAFNNMFLLRNPNFRFDAVLDYDQEGREKGIRPDQQTYVDALEQAFLQSPTVAAHFVDPVEAWQAGMRLNDGGISLIREKLRPLCNPSMKLQQIAASLEERQTRLVARLKPFWKSDNREEERAKKDAFSYELSKFFAGMVENQQFGEFLAQLRVEDYALHDLYFGARRRMNELCGAGAHSVGSSDANSSDAGSSDASSRNASSRDARAPRAPREVMVGTTVQADDLLADLFGDTPPVTLGNAQAEPDETLSEGGSVHYRDEAAYFAALIEGYWFNRLHELADTVVLQQHYRVPAIMFSGFVSELTLGATRLHLRTNLEEALRGAAAYANIDLERTVWKQVSLAANQVNAYIDWLGFNPRQLAPGDRTIQARGREFVLFEPSTSVQGMPHLPEDQVAFDKAWVTDWLRALRASIMANVDFDGQQLINHEQNSRIGAVIARLAMIS